MNIGLKTFLKYSGKKLPYDAEVEYLKSTGTQWIDTGWYPDMRVGMSIDGRVGFNTTSRGMFISAYSFQSNNNVSIELYSSRTFRIHDGNSDVIMIGQVAPLNELFNVNITYLNGVFNAVVNGLSRRGTAPTAGRILNTLTARLGNDHRNSYMWGIFGPVIIYNPTLIHDFIPVRFTNENGVTEGAMYDRRGVGGMNPNGSLRTDGLYRNRGTGSFIVGPDKK